MLSFSILCPAFQVDYFLFHLLPFLVCLVFVGEGLLGGGFVLFSV